MRQEGMSFCFECGENLGGNSASKCSSCGWSLTTELNKKIPKGKQPCPDCGKRGKSLKECGICRESWYCNWCHKQRTTELREWAKISIMVWSEGSRGMVFDPEKDEDYDEFFLWRELLDGVTRYEPCLECAIKYVESRFDKWLNPELPLGMEWHKSFLNERDREYLLEELQRFRKNILQMCGFSKESLTSNPLDD
jgi:hypothetical protein